LGQMKIFHNISYANQVNPATQVPE
jgi:hypothetical protein